MQRLGLGRKDGRLVKTRLAPEKVGHHRGALRMTRGPCRQRCGRLLRQCPAPRAEALQHPVLDGVGHDRSQGRLTRLAEKRALPVQA